MLRMRDRCGGSVQFRRRGEAPGLKCEGVKGGGVNGVENRSGATLAEAAVLVRPPQDVGLADDRHCHRGTGQPGHVIQLPEHLGDAADGCEVVPAMRARFFPVQRIEASVNR